MSKWPMAKGSSPMKSMTGYGRGESAQNGFKITVEVSSVNRKQTEIAVNLPRDLEVLEAQIRDEINRRIARGRLTVRLSVHAAEGAATSKRLNPALEDDRLLKEVFYFADHADISEELTRLQSHFQQFDDCVKSREPIGRTLDFLAQEINRELNTLGSKANDSLISREVVVLKAELEKFREQVQNVE